MSPIVLALALLLAATPTSKWIEVLSTTDQNISASIQLTGKQMHVELCCSPNRYSLAIAQGTCAAPNNGASALVVEHNDWRPSNGKFVANVASVFPIHSSQPYHLFVVDPISGHPNDMLACGDVPADLTAR